MSEPFDRDVIEEAAEILIAKGGPVAMVGQSMKNSLTDGGRAAWAALYPAGKPGMSRERREAKARAERMLPVLRRRFWPDQTGQEAAAGMRMALLYAQRVVERDTATFEIAETDINSLHYWCVDFVRTGALLKNGKVIETETLRKKMVRRI